MTQFFRLNIALFSILLCFFTISIYPKASFAQNNDTDSVTVRINAQNPVIVEGEDGTFDIFITRSSSKPAEEVDVFFSLTFSGDFFSGTPESQQTTLMFAADENHKIHQFPTEKDNLFEQNGSVVARVTILSGSILIPGVNYDVATISVLNEVSQDKLVSSTHKAVIPEVAKAVNSSVFNAVSDRIDQFPNKTTEPTSSLNSTNSFINHDLINKISQSSKSHQWQHIIDDLSFGFAATHGNVTPTSFFIWGKGEYQQISGNDDKNGIDWDGRVIGGHIGFDTKLSTNTIGGLLSTYSSHNLDFKLENQQYSGQSTHKMVSFFPYLGWTTQSQSFNIWTSGGLGLGQVDLDTKFQRGCQDDRNIECLYTKSRLYAAALGTKAKVFSGNLFNGESELNLKGKVTGSQFALESDSTEEDEIIVRGDEFHNFQAHLTIENSNQFPLSTNYKLNPVVSIGGRWDGGDGLKGYGVGINANLGLQANWGAIESFGNYLIIHNEDSVNEWGAGGKIKFDYGLDQLGSILNFSLNSGFNLSTPNSNTNNWAQQLLKSSLVESNENPSNHQLEGMAGYGFALGNDSFTLTPFISANLSMNNPDYLHFGNKFSFSSNASLEVKTTHELTPDRDNNQLYSIAGTIRW